MNNVVYSIIGTEFENIVVVGAAEGYYAVGLAMTTGANIDAFEISPEGQRLIYELAKLNDVSEKISVHGECDRNELANVLNGSIRQLIIMDVEGAELELLDVEEIKNLCCTHILVELHDFLVPEVSQVIYDRFYETHTIQIINQVERDLDDYPFTFTVPERIIMRRFILSLLSEGRQEQMSWYYMEPK